MVVDLTKLLRSTPKKVLPMSIATEEERKTPKKESLSELLKIGQEIGKQITPGLKDVIKTKAKEIIKQPSKLLEIPTTPAELTQKISIPYSKEVLKEAGTSIKETGKAISELKEGEKSKTVLLNNLYQAISGIPAAIITPAITKGIEVSGQGDKIAKSLIDLGKIEAEKTGIDIKGLTDQDYLNIGATNIDAGTALLSFGLSKAVTSSLLKGLKVKGIKIKEELKPKVGEAVDKLAAKTGAKLALLPEETKKTPTLKETIKKEPTKKELKTIESEKKLPTLEELQQIKLDEAKGGKVTTVGKLKPEEIKAFAEAKEKKPDLTIEKFRELPNIDIKKIIKETPKVDLRKTLKTEIVKEPVQVSQITTRLEEGGKTIKGKNFAYNPKKLEGAKNDILEGKSKPVKLETNPTTGKLIIVDGHHRIDAAIELGQDIPAIVDKQPTIIQTSKIETLKTEETVTPKIDLKNLIVKRGVTPEKGVIPKEVKIEKSITTEQPFGEAETQLNTIANNNFSQAENVKYELGITSAIIQKTPFAKDVSNLLSKGYIDIRNKLNTIIVDIEGKLNGFGDILSSLQRRKVSLVDEGINEFKINELVDWAKNNSNILKDTVKNLKLDYGKGIKGDLGKIQGNSIKRTQYYETIFKDNDLDNLRYLSNSYFYNKNILGKDIISEFPEVIQSKLLEIENNYRSSYTEDGLPINESSLEYQLTTKLGNILEDNGLLRYKREGYTRGVINDLVFQYIKKNKKSIEELGIEVGDYEDFVKKGYDPTISQTGDIPKWISSILKKSRGAEMYHIQDPITRMISYLDEASQLIVNKDIVDTLNKARLDKKINTYIGKDSDNLARTILGLHDITGGQKIVGKVGSGLAASAIIGSTSIPVMSAVTTLARSATSILRYTKLRPFDTAKVLKYMEDSGLESKYINNTLIGKGYELAYSTFGGGLIDKQAKAVIANSIIYNQLKRLGINVNKIKYGDLVDTYKTEINKLDAGKQAYLQSELARELADISDFSNFSRGQVFGLQSRIFNTLKNFGRTTLSRYASYPAQIVNDVYYKIKEGQKGVIDSNITRKATFLVSNTLLTYYIAKKTTDLFWGESKNQEDSDRKEILSNKMMGGDLPEIIGMMLSNPINFPAISILSGTFNNFIKSIIDFNINGFDITKASDYSKLAAISRQLGLLLKEKETTIGGVYKYNNEWSDNGLQNSLTFLLGYSDGRLDYETAKKRIENIQEGDKGLITKTMDSIFRSQGLFSFGLSETSDILKYGLAKITGGKPDINNQLYQFILRTESKDNIDNLLSNIENKQDIPMSAEEWIRNAYDGFEVQIGEKDILKFLPNVVSSNVSDQKALLKIIDELGINNSPLYKGDMNEFMRGLKDTNPDLYTSILKKIINPVVLKIDNARLTVGELQFTGQESGASFIDEIIVERMGSKRLASDIANRFSDIIGKNPTDEELESYNTLLETSSRLGYLWDNIVDSMSLVTADKLKSVEGIKGKIQDKSFLQEAVKQALRLKGIKFIEDKVTTEETITPEEIKIEGKVKGKGGKAKVDLKGLLIPKPKLEKVERLPEIQTSEDKIEPLFRNIERQGGVLAELIRQQNRK